MKRAQTLVEFALVLPIMLTLFLGACSIGYIGLHVALLQHATDNLSSIAAATADRPSEAVIRDEADRAGCHEPVTFTLTWPDGGHEPGERVAVSLSCRIPDLLDNGGRDLSASSTAVVR